MDRHFELRGTTFVWHEAKASENERRHGVSFEEAATAFDDPLLRVQDAGRNDEERYAIVGFSSTGRLLTVVHVETEGECIRIISARRASATEEAPYDQ